MKSPGRVVLAIVAVVALVAGITFVKQYQVTPTPPPSPSAAPTTGAKTQEVKLTFPKGTIWEWDTRDGQFEQHSKGHKDFSFQNDNPGAIELGLKAKSCKCSEVSVGVADGGANAADVKTQPLEVDELKGVKVEPGKSGVIRLAWEDKKEKSSEDRMERLVVDIWVQAQGGGPRTIYKLELPVTFVPALRIRPSDAVLRVPDLYLNGKETKEFKCWSSTRQSFSLKAREQKGDPCFTYTCTRLDDQAREQLAEATKSHVLCGYSVRVTVNERLDDNTQMELGPFGRRIELSSDPGIDPTTVLVAGVVRGDIVVETEDERGGIILGPVPARDGKTKTVKLTSQRPGLELQLDKVEPEGSTQLKVKSLNKLPPVAGRTKWELTLEVPPGPSGRLPEHSAIRLTIPGNPPRHIRIPVSGFATQ